VEEGSGTGGGARIRRGGTEMGAEKGVCNGGSDVRSGHCSLVLGGAKPEGKARVK
jgi:hypothetical protein